MAHTCLSRGKLVLDKVIYLSGEPSFLETLREPQGMSLFKEPSKNPSKSRVLLHDPLGVRPLDVLGSVFGRTDFSRIFILSRRIFSRIFEPPDFFSSFLWGKVLRKILQENPRQNHPPNFIQQKSQHISAEGSGQKRGVSAILARHHVKVRKNGVPSPRYYLDMALRNTWGYVELGC